MFTPKFEITPRLTRYLMDIEASRQAVAAMPISARVLTSLRESARLLTTHYSTQIEGNRLTQAEVANVLAGGTFPNRERDETEVKNYFLALEHLDKLIEASSATLNEEDIQTLHGLVMDGRKRATPYRDGQNVIKDSSSGAIVYMPPEATDVPDLMRELIAWVNEQEELPAPITAGIAHYQFATIHPYYDGNGRTARLLTNLVLHNAGYGLKGIYSLEEYYARNLGAYYEALTIGESHNYYMGRAESDITAWIEYFCGGMADAFANVRHATHKMADSQSKDQSALLRELDQRQKQVLSLFQKSRFVKTREIAELLGVQPRTALNLCNQWVSGGFIVRHGTGNRNRKYELAETWSKLVE